MQVVKDEVTLKVSRLELEILRNALAWLKAGFPKDWNESYQKVFDDVIAAQWGALTADAKVETRDNAVCANLRRAGFVR